MHPGVSKMCVQYTDKYGTSLVALTIKFSSVDLKAVLRAPGGSRGNDSLFTKWYGTWAAA